jgi:DNA-binding transcriptional LysR family regulator
MHVQHRRQLRLELFSPEFAQIILGHRRDQSLSWQINVNGEFRRIFAVCNTANQRRGPNFEAVITGMKLCQLPVSLLRPHLEAGASLSILEDIPSIFIDVHALWPKAAHLRPMVRHAVDILASLRNRADWTSP